LPAYALASSIVSFGLMAFTTAAICCGAAPAWRAVISVRRAVRIPAALRVRPSWLLPVAFVAAMLAGAWAGLGEEPFGTGETMIVASLIILGAMIMRAHAFSVYAAAAICLVFGAFHGYAHGTEAGSSGSYNAYLAGLVIATALLHLAGMGVGLMLRIASLWGLRIAGALIAGAGLWFAVGLAT